MSISKRYFLVFYHKYKDKIFTYFLYRVNFNSAIAEDLTSDVFLKALKSFESFDQSRSFSAWMYAIARNHLVNHYRTANREVELTQAKNPRTDCLELVELSLELEKIIKEIEKLDFYHREVLLLRFVDGLSNEEIADVLDKEEGAVRTQISRALGELRDKLPTTYYE